MGARCLSPIALEQLALADSALPAARAHVARCSACRRLIDEIRENQRFLDSAGDVLADALATPRSLKETTFLPTDAVAGYELHEEVARGGQGVVYRAVQSSTRRPAAVKVLLAGALANQRQLRRFEREIEIAASLRHRNLVTVFGSGESSEGHRYVAMEFVNGQPIDSFVAEHVPATDHTRRRVDAVVRLVRDVAAGVGHAHASGVIHRDLKPSNILVEADATPRVLDFGLARPAQAHLDTTATHDFVGTPAYAAPEQLGADPSRVGTRTDVYALGLVLYRLLTGKHPYPCDGPFVDVVMHALETPPVPPSRLVPRLPTDVETIILKCLSKDPERRYANGAALAADLDDYLEGRPISARRDSTAYVLRRLALRHRVPTIAGLLLLITILGAAIGFAMLAGNLDRARRSAVATLAVSEIVRARLMVKTADLERAESTLWSRAIEAGVTGEDGAIPLKSSPQADRARWALMELYSRQPCVARAACDDVPLFVKFNDDNSLTCINVRGAQFHWDMRGRVLDTTPPLADELSKISGFDPSGALVVIGSPDSIRLIDMRSRKTLAHAPTTQPRGAATLQADIDDDLATVAVWYAGTSSLRILDARSLSVLREFDERVLTASFARGPSGERWLLAGSAGSEDPRIFIFQAPDWRLVKTLPFDLFPQSAAVIGVSHPACHGDPEITAVIGGCVGAASVVDPERPPRVASIGSTISRTLVDPQRRRMAVNLREGVTVLLNRADFSELRRIPGDGVPSALDFDPAIDHIAIGSASGHVRILELEERRWLAKLDSTPVTHADVDIARDGALAWVDDDGRLHITLPGQSSSFSVSTGDGVLNAVAFSADGSRILTAGMAGVVRCWDRRGTLIRTVGAGLPRVSCARFSSKGAIAACGIGGTAYLWRDDAGEPLVLEAGGARAPQLAFSPDGNSLAVVSVIAGTSVWDVDTGERRLTFDGHDEDTRVVAFSPDARFIATGADDRTVCIWDARTGLLLRRITGLPSSPFDLQFHTSGKVIFAVGRTGELVVLDPELGEELATFEISKRSTFALAQSADGADIFIAGEERWIGVLDLDYLARYLRGNEAYWRSYHADPTPDHPAAGDAH